MRVASFYHVWTPGFWEEPLDEYLRALDDTRFEGSSTVSYVTEGNESYTINLVHCYALENEGAVVYAHTKGATTGYNHLQGPWRWLMTAAVIGRWRENLAALESYDAVGWAWLDERVPGASRCYVGNFWMARCSYLRTLPPCIEDDDRGKAEGWLGLNNPRVLERVDWDREVGPPVLDQIWPILRERWRTAGGEDSLEQHSRHPHGENP